MSEYRFPEGFLWGAATSSYQVEGGINHNDWAEAARLEQVPPAGRACDSYNRYEEDFDIAKSLGHNAHRFSIEWSRIEPEEGQFSQEAIEHYRKVLQALRDRGLEPIVTLWHYTLPVWFSQKGGFENKNSPEIFARYCEYLVSQLGDQAKLWVTINEPMVYTGFGYVRGSYPPFKKNFIISLRVIKNLIMSHNVAYTKIKTKQPSVQVGIALDVARYFHDANPLNILVVKFMDWFRNFRFLNRIKNHYDFIGIQYYRPLQYGTKISFEKNGMGWDIYPKGIYELLARFKSYKKPIYITENGIPDATDPKRTKFIQDHLQWVHRAIQYGVDVRGYMYWSLLDNYEWAHGYFPRFGLVEMNYDTMKRMIRPSAYEYAKICKANKLIF